MAWLKKGTGSEVEQKTGQNMKLAITILSLVVSVCYDPSCRGSGIMLLERVSKMASLKKRGTSYYAQYYVGSEQRCVTSFHGNVNFRHSKDIYAKSLS